MQLRRIIYVSRALQGLQEVELRQIFGLAEVLHRRGDLSGLLAYTGRHFIQLIEGPAPQVDQLLSMIAADDRHRGMRTLCDETPQSRDFQGWHWMRVDSLDLIDEVDEALRGEDIGAEQAKRLIQRLVAASPPEAQP